MSNPFCTPLLPSVFFLDTLSNSCNFGDKRAMSAFNRDFLTASTHLKDLDPDGICAPSSLILNWLRPALKEIGVKDAISDEQMVALGSCGHSLLLGARAGCSANAASLGRISRCVRRCGNRCFKATW